MSHLNTENGADATNQPVSLEDQLASLQAQLTAEQAETAKWKTFSRKHEDDLKSLRASYEREGQISEALKTTGLPEAAKTFLTGKTAEEINTQAESLKALFGIVAPSAETTTTTTTTVETPTVEIQAVETPVSDDAKVFMPEVQKPVETPVATPQQTVAINPLQGAGSAPIAQATGDPFYDALIADAQN